MKPDDGYAHAYITHTVHQLIVLAKSVQNNELNM